MNIFERQVFNNQLERMSKTMNIGIDHGYYAIKTRHFSFPAGISEYSYEPYTLDGKESVRAFLAQQKLINRFQGK